MQNVGKSAAVSMSDVDAPMDIYDVDNDACTLLDQSTTLIDAVMLNEIEIPDSDEELEYLIEAKTFLNSHSKDGRPGSAEIQTVHDSATEPNGRDPAQNHDAAHPGSVTLNSRVLTLSRDNTRNIVSLPTLTGRQ